MSIEQQAAHAEQTKDVEPVGEPVEKPETVAVKESNKELKEAAPAEPTQDNEAEKGTEHVKEETLQDPPTVQVTQDATPQNDTQEESTQQTSETQDVAKPNEEVTKKESTQQTSESKDAAKPTEEVAKDATAKAETSAENKTETPKSKAEADSKEKKKSSLCTVL